MVAKVGKNPRLSTALVTLALLVDNVSSNMAEQGSSWLDNYRSW